MFLNTPAAQNAENGRPMRLHMHGRMHARQEKAPTRSSRALPPEGWKAITMPSTWPKSCIVFIVVSSVFRSAFVLPSSTRNSVRRMTSSMIVILLWESITTWRACVQAEPGCQLAGRKWGKAKKCRKIREETPVRSKQHKLGRRWNF